MNSETPEEIAQRYLKAFEEIDNALNYRSCNFRHVVANLVLGLQGCSGSISAARDEDARQGAEVLFTEFMNAVENYFSLLENYPQFKEAELNTRNGYFPEFHYADYGKEGFSSPSTCYVALSRKMLEDKQSG